MYDIGHEPPLYPPEPDFRRCINCDGEIYPGDEAACHCDKVLEIWEYDGALCESCLDELFDELSFYQKAELFGGKVMTGAEIAEEEREKWQI